MIYLNLRPQCNLACLEEVVSDLMRGLYQQNKSLLNYTCATDHIKVLPLRTVLTGQSVQIEVLWQVAGNALLVVPEGKLSWALTPVSLLVGNLVALTGMALVILTIVVVVLGAAHALGTIEAWSLGGTVLAFLILEVVDLPVGTVLASPALHVEVLGEVADDAVEAVPVLSFRTDAFAFLFVIGLTPGTVLAVLVFRVEIGGLDTNCALVSIEVGLFIRTVHAHLLLIVEDLAVRTVPALQAVVVEEARHIAANTFLIIPVELFRTPALPIHDHRPTLAR